MATNLDPLLLAHLRGELPTVCARFGGEYSADEQCPRLILPGSFNPLHHGHRRLAEVASVLTGHIASFELSTANVDKPDLAAEVVASRVAQFADVAPIWITRAPTFVLKAKLFPECVFVIGYDTATRLLDPKYAEGSVALLDEYFAIMRDLGCRFVVAGRVDGRGVFQEWQTAHELFEPIPAMLFREDVSSTLLRSGSLPAEAIKERIDSQDQ